MVVCLAVGCKRGCTHVMGCRAFCEVSEPPGVVGFHSLVRQLVRHQETAQEQAFKMTDWHITAFIRGRHDTNITSLYRSAAHVVLRVCVHSFASTSLYHYATAMVAPSGSHGNALD
jgi:hypothetical protein